MLLENNIYEISKTKRKKRAGVYSKLKVDHLASSSLLQAKVVFKHPVSKKKSRNRKSGSALCETKNEEKCYAIWNRQLD